MHCRPGTSDPWVLWDVFHHEFQSLPPEMPEPKCIVDLGANVGYTAAYYATRFPGASILAVEMDQANFDVASRNVEAFAGRCRAVHAAVWDQDGELEYEGQEEQGFRVATHGGASADGSGRRVVSRELSSLFNEFGIEHVDFLKMDIEGAEAVVLRGPLEWLSRVGALKIEYHAPMTFDACVEILSGQGYTCRPDDRHDHCVIAVRHGPSPNPR